MSGFAAIFDWDGVIIDSSAQHERSWELLAAERNLFLPEGHFKQGFGKKNELIIRTLLHWSTDPTEIAALGDRKEELYRELVRDQGVEVLPGAWELLTALKEAGIPRALGSSTPRGNLNALFAVTHLNELLDGVVCGDDVTHGKPDPEVFLKAAALINAEPARSVVFEDALFGIEAAQRAGMKVVAVATTNPPELLTHADRVIPTLAGITVAELEGLFS